METDHFGSFTTSAIHHMRQVNSDFLQKYSDMYFARWTFDPDPMTLTFTDKYDRILLVLDYIEIGTFSHQSRTWRWGWSTPGVPEAMQRRSLLLRELQQITDGALFSNPEPFAVWEDMPYKLSAMSVRYLHAIACFNFPIENNRLQIWLAVMKVLSAADPYPPPPPE